MDFHAMKRKELQALCKKHGILANIKNIEMAEKLESIFKEKEKPVLIGKSCLKNVVDLASDDCLKDDLRKEKKVRFSPRDELVEYDLEDQSDPRNDRAKARAMRKVAMSKPVLNKDQVRSTRSHMRKSIAADLSFPPFKKRLRSSGRSTDSGFEDDINNLKAADDKESLSGPSDENLAGKCELLGNGQIKKRSTRATLKSNVSVVISEASGTVGFGRRLTRSRKKSEEEVLHLEEPNSKRGGRKGVNQKSVGTAKGKAIIDENKKKHDESPEIEAHTKLANENENDRLPTRRSRRNTSLSTSSTSFDEGSNEFVGRKKPQEQVKEPLPCEEISETVKFKRRSTRAKCDLSADCKEQDMTVNENRRNGRRKIKMVTVMEEETQESVANAKLLDKGVGETISENKAVEPVSEVEQIQVPVLNHAKEDNSSSVKTRPRSGRNYSSKHENGNKLQLSSHRDTVAVLDKNTVLLENIETIETKLTPEVEEIHAPLLNHFKDDIGSEKMMVRSGTRSSSKKQTGNKLQLSSHKDTVAAQDKDIVLTEKVETVLTSEVEEIHVPLSNLFKEDDFGSEKMRLRSTTKSTSKKQITDKLQFSIMDIIDASEKDSVPMDKEETQEIVANKRLLDIGVVETMSENTAIEPSSEVKEIQGPVLNHIKEDNSGIEKMGRRSGRKSSSKKKNGNKVEFSSHRDTVAAPDKDTVMMANIETTLISEVEQIHVPLFSHFKEDYIGSEKMRLRSGTKSTSKKQISDKLQFSIKDTVGAAEKDSVSMDKEEQILPTNCVDEGDDDQACQSQQRNKDVDQIDLDKPEPGERESCEDDSPVDDSSALHGLDSMGKPGSTLSLGVEIEGDEDSLAVKQAHSASELHDNDHEDDNVSVQREENSADSKEGTGSLSESVQECHLDECNESEGPNENCENALGDAENMLNSSDKIGTPLMSLEGVNNDDKCYVDAAGNEKTPSDCQASVGRALYEMITEIEINTQMHPGEKMENIGNSSAVRHIHSSIDFEECLDDDQFNDSNGFLPELFVEKYCEKASEASLETLYGFDRTGTSVMSPERLTNEDYASENGTDLQVMVSSSHASSCRIDTPLNAIIDNEHKGMSGHCVTACATRIDNDTQQEEENQMKMDTLDQSTILERSSKLNVEDLECCNYDSQSHNVTMCKEDIFGGNFESAINLEERTGDVVMEEISKHVEAAAELPAPRTDDQMLINRESSSTVKDNMHEVSNGEEDDSLSGQFSIEVTATPTSCSKEGSLNHDTNIFDKTVPDGEAVSTMFGSPVFQEALAVGDKKYIGGFVKTPPTHISDSDDCLAGKSGGIRNMDTEGALYPVLDSSCVVADAKDRESEVLIKIHEADSTQGFHAGDLNMSSFKNMPSVFDHINGQDQTNFQVVDESTFEGASKDDDAEVDITKSTFKEKVLNCELEHGALIEDIGGSLPQNDPNFFASGNESRLLDEVIAHYFFEDGTAEKKEKYKAAFGSVGSKSLPAAKISAPNYPDFVSMNVNDYKKDLVVRNGCEDIVKETTSRSLNVTYGYRTEDKGLKQDYDIELCDDVIKERNAEIFAEAELTDGVNSRNVVLQMTGSPFSNFEETISKELKESEEKTTVEMIQNSSLALKNANSNMNAQVSYDTLQSKASDYASSEYESESAVEISIFEAKECTNLLVDMEKKTIQKIDELMSADISDHEDSIDQELKQSYFDKEDLNLVEESSVAVEIDVTIKEIHIVDGNDSGYISAENVGTLQQLIEANYGRLENKDEGLIIPEYGESAKGDFFAETNESYVDSNNKEPITEKVENVADMNYDDCAISVDCNDSVDRVNDTFMDNIGDSELFVDASADLGTNNLTALAPTTSSSNDDNTSNQNDNEATLEYSMVAKAVEAGSANKLLDSDTQLATSENSSDVLAVEPESIGQAESHVFTSREINLLLEDFEQYEVKGINQNEALITMTESSTTQNIDAENLHENHQMEEKVSQPHASESISEQAAAPKENASDEPIFYHDLENAFVSADIAASDEPTTEGVDAQNTQIVQPDLDLNETKPGTNLDENTSFPTKQLNSSMVKGTNSIAELIHGTPQKSAWTHDMKENASMMKTDQTTIVKSTTKRRALGDIQRKS